MNVSVLDLRPLKSLSATEKDQLPVSVIMADGLPLVVSRFGDDVWDLYPYFAQENKRASDKMIDWRIQLPDGRVLTDPAHSGLLRSTKDFIWSLFADPVEGRKRPAMKSVRLKLHDLKQFLRWMVSQGFTRFADLTGHTLEYVPQARCSNTTALVASASTIAARLLVVEDLYHQRDKLDDALSVHPWPGESAWWLSGQKRGRGYDKPRTDPLPDAVARRLIEAALDYVHVRAARIIDALAAASDVAARSAAAGGSISARSKKRSIAARQFGYEDAWELKTEGTRLRTACYIVIDMFSGIRDSEMMSLGEDCISSGVSKDGSTDVWWLHGTIYKTGMRPKKWLVPPVVRDAIDVLTKLTAVLRDALRREELELEQSVLSLPTKTRAEQVKRLATVRRQKDKLFLSLNTGEKGGRISVLSGKGMTVELKRFCADLHILGDDGKPYPLHAHQFRRTYARFVARAELGDLLTLRDHLGHLSIDMTTLYADGGADDYDVDMELLEMVATEKLDCQNTIMTNYLDSDAPLANGEHWLKEWRDTVRTAANKEELIAEYAGTITLNGTGHSWCIGNAKGTGCGGLCVFEADMCVDCNYGMIGPEYLPVWKGIASQQEEALAMSDVGIPGKARAQRILDKAHEVIRRLET
ncbi:MAG: integrase [Propionivibrio sp.]|nr:integrase [Propionivibrio sp.]